MTLVVRLSGSYTIQNVEQTLALLRDTLASDSSIQLDCSAIDAVDITFIQVIIAARKSAQQKGGDLALTAHADGPLLEALDLAGIRSERGQAFWFEGAAVP
jgi:anti-anti-sigma regulatory factor